MWGIIPAAGAGSRIQPLAFSKELLPVGSRMEGDIERPKAVSEYLVERMITGGAGKICFVISPGKSDIMEYYGSGIGEARFCYTVQTSPKGLCDAIFSARTVIDERESVIIGLPDTVWFPSEGLAYLPDDILSFLLFPVEHPEFFDAVETDSLGFVKQIRVKQSEVKTRWIWGAFKMPGKIFIELFELWKSRNCSDEYMGSLVNAFIENGGRARGIRLGQSYVDVGTLNGYREAIKLLLAHRRLQAG
ncbi:MAG: sugar phosphate nucleotidyltransferase [Syntrophothermus sp.]